MFENGVVGDADDHTQDPRRAVHCAAILGDYQPGLSTGTMSDNPATEGLTQLIPGGGFAPGSPGLLPPHAGGVCPDQSTWETICVNSNAFRAAGFSGAAPGPGAGEVPTAQEKQPTPKEIEDALDKIKKPIEDLDKLREKLGLPPTVPLPPEVTQGIGLGGSSTGSGSGAASDGLLDFLLGP